MINKTVEPAFTRSSTYPISPIFMERWSRRALSGESISEKELMTLFEAARWAPSCFNNQHWRFIYALKNSSAWPEFFGLLGEFNQKWTEKAGALIVILSKKSFDHNQKPSATHSFDAGAAWMSLALQGSIMGLVLHGMAGFDFSKARLVVDAPEDYAVEAMVAVGRPGKREDLPQEMQEKESPSQRKALVEIAFAGKLKHVVPAQ